MPGFNQKGPMGQGPMSGRKVGKCTNYGANAKKDASADNSNSAGNFLGNNVGRGFGNCMRHGNGLGAGRQHRFRNGQ